MVTEIQLTLLKETVEKFIKSTDLDLPEPLYINSSIYLENVDKETFERLEELAEDLSNNPKCLVEVDSGVYKSPAAPTIMFKLSLKEPIVEESLDVIDDDNPTINDADVNSDETKTSDANAADDSNKEENKEE